MTYLFYHDFTVGINNIVDDSSGLKYRGMDNIALVNDNNKLYLTLS